MAPPVLKKASYLKIIDEWSIFEPPMDILLVGNDRYVGERLIDRILLEGEQVGVAGLESLPRAYDANENVKFCEYDILSEDFTEVFNVFAPEVVVYYNNCQRDYKYDFTLDDVNRHVKEFLRTTQTALEKKTRKFIYISTCSAYETTIANPDENSPVQANNFWEAAHTICEQHIRNISAVENADYLILRAATLYGPGQNKKNSEIALYLDSKRQNNQRYSAMSEAETDYIYIDDFVSAVYKAIGSAETGIINIASGGKIETNLLHRVIDGLYLKHIIHANAFSLIKGVSIERAIRSLGFMCHTSLVDGLTNTVRYRQGGDDESGFSKRKHQRKAFFENLKEKWNKRGVFKEILSYVEILALFAVVAYFTLARGETMLLGFIDIRVLYIMVVSATYGVRRTSLATLLCIILVVYDFIYIKGYDPLVLLYDYTVLSAILAFLFVGMLWGFLKDRNQQHLNEMTADNEKKDKQLEHVRRMYNESLRVKDALQRQILKSENSLGQMFEMVSKLDSLNIDRLRSDIITVTEQIMDSHSVAFFRLSRDKKFMRLLAKSADLEIDRKSILVADSREFSEIIKHYGLYVNRDIAFNGNIRMAYTIEVDGEIIAIVALYDIVFDDLNLSYQNRFVVAMSMVTQSVIRAYQYSKAVEDKIYYDGTNILKPDPFKDRVMQSVELKEKGKQDYVLVEVVSDNLEKSKQIVPTMIREYDYVGLGNGKLFVLYNNTSLKEFEFVKKRLSANNINVKLIDMGI